MKTTKNKKKIKSTKKKEKKTKYIEKINTPKTTIWGPLFEKFSYHSCLQLPFANTRFFLRPTSSEIIQ